MKPTEKLSDPVIDEIREVRHRISESVGHDPAKLVNYYRRLQEQYRDRLTGGTPTWEQNDHSAA
jgi:hypothetical protein